MFVQNWKQKTDNQCSHSLVAHCMRNVHTRLVIVSRTRKYIPTQERIMPWVYHVIIWNEWDEWINDVIMIITKHIRLNSIRLNNSNNNLLFLCNLILCWMRVSVISFVCFNKKCILWFASPVKFMKRESFILHIALYRYTFGCVCVCVRECASAAAAQRRNKYIFHATKHRRIELTVPRTNNSEK